jgi:hypothetical protein
VDLDSTPHYANKKKSLWKRKEERTYISTIRNFDRRWILVVSITSRPLYPQGSYPRYPVDRRLRGGGGLEPVWTLGIREKSLLLSGIEPWFLGRSLVRRFNVFCFQIKSAHPFKTFPKSFHPFDIYVFICLTYDSYVLNPVVSYTVRQLKIFNLNRMCLFWCLFNNVSSYTCSRNVIKMLILFLSRFPTF